MAATTLSIVTLRWYAPTWQHVGGRGGDYWEEKHGSHRAVPRRAAAAWRRPAVVCGHAAVARPSLPTHLLRQLL